MPGLSTKPDIEGGVNWSQLIYVDLSLLKIFFTIICQTESQCFVGQGRSTNNLEWRWRWYYYLNHFIFDSGLCYYFIKKLYFTSTFAKICRTMQTNDYSELYIYFCNLFIYSFTSAKGCSLQSLQIITNSHLMFLIFWVPR